MNRIVIQTITLECITNKSNKFYDVALVVENNKLKIETEYGAIGATPKQGVSGSFVIPDVRESAGSSAFENSVSKLVHEANQILNSKVKKGYTGNVTSFQPVFALQKIYSHFPSNAEQKAAAPTQATSKSQAINSFEVEVIDIDWPRLKIAKVLESIEYELIGEVQADMSKTYRIGDIIRVLKSNKGYALA